MNEETKTIVVRSQKCLEKQILEREAKIDALRYETAQAAFKTINEVIAQGRDLTLIQGLVQGEFSHWLTTNFPKSERIARRYIVVAEKAEKISFLDDTKFQAELFRVAELVPECEPRAQTSEVGFVVPPIIQRLNFVAEWAVKELDTVGTWDETMRKGLKQKLRPVVELYQNL